MPKSFATDDYGYCVICGGRGEIMVIGEALVDIDIASRYQIKPCSACDGKNLFSDEPDEPEVM